MNDDDDATVFQTEEDREIMEKDIQDGRYELDTEDETITVLNS